MCVRQCEELCADYEQHLAAACRRSCAPLRQENDALRRHAQTLVMQNQNLSAQNATLAGQVDKLQSYRTNLETQYLHREGAQPLADEPSWMCCA